jgi:predicted nucleic acid-binding protein
VRRLVVDASVAALWYFPEEHTPRAESLLQVAKLELLTPGLLHVEMAALVRERVRRGEIDGLLAERILVALRKAPLDVRPTSELAQDALALMLRDGLSLHDSFYLALAVQAGCPVVTADSRLLDEVRGGPHEASVLWIGDLA